MTWRRGSAKTIVEALLPCTWADKHTQEGEREKVGSSEGYKGRNQTTEMLAAQEFQTNNKEWNLVC